MLRTLFSMTAALGLLVAACGDDKGTTETETSPNTSTGPDATSTGPDGTTTPDTPTSTGIVDPSTTSTGPDPTTNPDPSTTTSTTSDDTTTDVTTLTTTTVGTDTTDPNTDTGGDPVESCKMMADPMTECSDCVCENCLMELQECEADEGCKAIRQCAEETGCSGFDCLQTCGDVIDMYGGIGGDSAGLGLEISMCLDMNCMDVCG
jgi:hypothetical protein